MSRPTDRITRSFTWRRGILLVATIAIAMVLLERDRRLRAWHAAVAEAASGLVSDDGDGTDWAVPGAEIVAREAAAAVAELVRPRRIAPVQAVPGSGLNSGWGRAEVSVVGADGRAVSLVWAGTPPRIVEVVRRDPPVTFRPPTDSSSGDTP